MGLNILHVIPKLTVGGVENQLALILKKYDKKKFPPFVCCLSDRGEIGSEIEAEGTEVIYLNKLSHRFDWTIVKDIQDFIRLRHINIIRTHQYHANLYGRLAARRAKVPCIISSVHNVYTIDKKIHRRMLNNYLAHFTDRVVAVSNAVKRDIMKYDGIPEEKISVIYNGIEMKSFLKAKENIRTELGIAPGAPVIATVGRLTHQKGQKFLLEAIAKLRKLFPQIVLVIAGDGPLRNELEDFAAVLKITNNVRFLGTRRDIPAILSAIDIFVLPSIWEGLSNALIEAMAAGKPVIATDIQPVREIINSENVGILIAPENCDAIVNYVTLLLNNREFAGKIGRSARERVFSAFNIEVTVNRYMSLFKEILQRKGVKFEA
ncbi:MAG: glycosyltransferase [Nitrospirota bacterium]